MQLHLLYLAEFHHHDEVTFEWRATTVREGTAQTQPVVATDALCVACQVVRRSAALPVTEVPTPKPTASASLPAAVLQGTFYSFHPQVLRGRAPPLS